MEITSEMINKHWADVRLSKKEVSDLVWLIDVYLETTEDPLIMKHRFNFLMEKLKQSIT